MRLPSPSRLNVPLVQPVETLVPAPTGPILVVDDDDEIRMALRRSIMDWGYEVVCAEDGEEAIRIAAKLRPALIVLDLQMPKMSGFAFRTWQLAQPRLAEIPVIVLTAAGPRAADRLVGVSALYKPFDVGLLQVFLNVHVQPASPRDLHRG